MIGINKVILLGYLGQDPEINYMKNGKAIAHLNIATTNTWKNKKTNNIEKKTEWHKVVIFDKLAESFCKYLKKGNLVYIEGSLQTRKWQDKNGIDKYITEIIINFNGTIKILNTNSNIYNKDLSKKETLINNNEKDNNINKNILDINNLEDNIDLDINDNDNKDNNNIGKNIDKNINEDEDDNDDDEKINENINEDDNDDDEKINENINEDDDDDDEKINENINEDDDDDDDDDILDDINNNDSLNINFDE